MYNVHIYIYVYTKYMCSCAGQAATINCRSHQREQEEQTFLNRNVKRLKRFSALPRPSPLYPADRSMPLGAAFTAAPIAATFLALLQRPVKIAQIRDDAFAPECEWKGEAGWWRGAGQKEGRWTSSASCPSVQLARLRPMQAFNRSRTRTRILARLNHCDPWPAHTHTQTHGHVCRAIHPAIDIRSRRCQPWMWPR